MYTHIYMYIYIYLSAMRSAFGAVIPDVTAPVTSGWNFPTLTQSPPAHSLILCHKLHSTHGI